MPEIEDPNAASRNFVLVRRADPAAGGADLPAGRALDIDQFMVGQHQMGPVADRQPTFDVDSAFDQSFDLREERLGIEHYAVADRAPHARVQHAAWDLLQNEAGCP